VTEPVILTHALTKRYGRLTAVDGVDLDVRAGDRYGFLGPNGSGKTTTVRMLLGLVYATSGSMEVLGRPMPRDLRSVLPDIGALVEGPARVTGLVTLGVALAPHDRAESLQALHDALRLSEKNGLRHNQAWCHNHIGVALRIMGSPEEALDHHRRAFELLEPLAEVQLEIDLLHASAVTYRAAGRPEEALALIDRTIELARKLNRPHDEELARAAREVVAESPRGPRPAARHVGPDAVASARPCWGANGRLPTTPYQ